MTVPNPGIPNRKLLEVFSKSVKLEETVARRHASQTRGDGCTAGRSSGWGHSFRAIVAAIASRKRPPARETGKQPQNLTALAVDRSGHLVRKYRLTYHQKKLGGNPVLRSTA
ncbi:hypothetical protein QUB70_30650 [Microcoleus sp. A003_D6]|uniref:hypothetical protein n=1 Tax=Microcoleus sp. A003_D6 TaxID=3055266 RepID=UPI002FD68AA8